jgi:16S rRNA (cytosine1402-N4)-methyltransferase
VMLDEVVGLLDPQPGEVYVDATAGLGGHAVAVGARLGEAGTVVLTDLDQSNLTRAVASVKAAGVGTVIEVQGNFAGLPRRLGREGPAIDLFLADLGFASTQVDDPERGLSFRFEGPLDMRLDRSMPFTAEELVNTWPENDLADLIFRYGEDSNARRIARKIVAARASGPIQGTRRLAEVVREACPRGPSRINPATKTFQALRIAVNDELGSLERLLKGLSRVTPGTDGWVRPGCRVVLISFHSLEDRLVKRCFSDLVSRGVAESLTRGPVTPSQAETSRNPRARSAKVRAVRFRGQDDPPPNRR